MARKRGSKSPEVPAMLCVKIPTHWGNGTMLANIYMKIALLPITKKAMTISDGREH